MKKLGNCCTTCPHVEVWEESDERFCTLADGREIRLRRRKKRPDWCPRMLTHEKQTNHDYIRTCSDADLADLLCKLVLVSSSATVGCKGCVVKDDCGGKSSGFLKWLRKEREMK